MNAVEDVIVARDILLAKIQVPDCIYAIVQQKTV